VVKSEKKDIFIPDKALNVLVWITLQLWKVGELVSVTCTVLGLKGEFMGKSLY